MWQTIKALENPREALAQIINESPKAKEFNALMKEANGNPDIAFQIKAKQMGVDPNEILALLE